MKHVFDHLLRVKGKEIRDRIVLKPQSCRTDQHQPVEPVRGERGNLRGQHTAQGVADDMRAIDLQLVEKIVVVQRKVNHVVNMLDTRSGAKAGMGRGVNGKILGEFLEKRRAHHGAAGTVQKQQRLAVAAPLH